MTNHLFIKILFTLFLLFSIHVIVGQEVNCYRLYLTDKNNSPYSVDAPQAYLSQRAIEKRERFQIPVIEEDLPVNPGYIHEICAISPDIQVLARSKWFNTVTVYCPDTILLSQINTLPFVVASETLPVAALDFFSKNESKLSFDYQEITTPQNAPQENNRYDYGYGYDQIAIHNGHLLHNEGFAGEGMLIAVLDAGWDNFDIIPVFLSLYENGQIKGAIDLIPDIQNVYTHHGHGTSVVSTMATKIEGEMVGTAPEADYFFIRSEHPLTEQLIEEDFWAFGAELADSLGADVINSSLGYTTFDFPYSGWGYEQCDGVSGIASLAATKAGEKGIVTCTSAGNEGNNLFYYVGRPGDAFNVLTVGAIDIEREPVPFSSNGPTYDGRIKPDVVAVGYNAVGYNSSGSLSYMNGTSFSSPILAGLAACLWQSLPNRSAAELMEIIRQSSHQFSNPDNKLGYGIPDFYKAYMDNRVNIGGYNREEWQPIIYPNPCAATFSIRFDAWNMKDISIFDLSGKLVKKMNNLPENPIVIDISSLPVGVYIGKITGKEGEREWFKIVKNCQ